MTATALFSRDGAHYAPSREGFWAALNEPSKMINLQGEIMVKRSFTYDDPDFAHRIMVLPSYTVQFTPMNITAMTWPGHEDCDR